jgi:hypothetical protein
LIGKAHLKAYYITLPITRNAYYTEDAEKNGVCCQASTAIETMASKNWLPKHRLFEVSKKEEKRKKEEIQSSVPTTRMSSHSNHTLCGPPETRLTKGSNQKSIFRYSRSDTTFS